MPLVSENVLRKLFFVRKDTFPGGLPNGIFCHLVLSGEGTVAFGFVRVPFTPGWDEGGGIGGKEGGWRCFFLVVGSPRQSRF